MNAMMMSNKSDHDIHLPPPPPPPERPAPDKKKPPVKEEEGEIIRIFSEWDKKK